MSEILFIRHAETDMAGSFCGHSDPDLNAHGRSQLSKLVAELRMEDIRIVYTSDLLRSRTTGHEIAGALAIKCTARPTLREINFGRWEGLTWKEIEQRDATYAQRWITQYPNLPAPDGESIQHFEKRVRQEVEFLAGQTENGSVAVVTHGGVLRTILSHFCRCSDEEAWKQTKDYCCIVRYKVPEATFPLSGKVKS